MSSQAQITANQANAQKSTGPKTEEGKAIASQNNFRYGFTGAFRVLAWEGKAEFQVLLDSLHAEHQPSTPTETILVDKMVHSLWLSKRAVLLQDLSFDLQAPLCDDPKQLALYLRYQTTNDRAFHKSLNELLKLRAEERTRQIGFESQQRRLEADAQKREEEARRKARHESRDVRQQNAEIRKQADHIRREAVEKRKQEVHRWNVLLAQAKVDKICDSKHPNIASRAASSASSQPKVPPNLHHNSAALIVLGRTLLFCQANARAIQLLLNFGHFVRLHVSRRAGVPFLQR